MAGMQVDDGEMVIDAGALQAQEEVAVGERVRSAAADDGAMERDAAAEAAAEGATGKAAEKSYPPVDAQQLLAGGFEMRRIPVPAHRYTPLKQHWMQVYTPIVQNLKLQIRMNLKARSVEIRTCEQTQSVDALQKAADFVKAFMLGFDVDDALALLRIDDLYVDSFEVHDGKDGQTKYAIENTTRTRIVVADTKIHILGSFQNIKVAKDAIVSLILGSPPGKVYSKLRTVSARMNERL